MAQGVGAAAAVGLRIVAVFGQLQGQPSPGSFGQVQQDPVHVHLALHVVAAGVIAICLPEQNVVAVAAKAHAVNVVLRV